MPFEPRLASHVDPTAPEGPLRPLENLETSKLRERSYRRTLRLGLLVSLALHVLILLLASFIRIGRPTLPEVVRIPAEREPGLVVILLKLLEPPPTLTQTPQRPQLSPEAARPVLPAETPVPAEIPSADEVKAEAEHILSNAERLQPRMGDERLWLDFRNPISVVTNDRLDEAVDALRLIVRKWLDSLALTNDQRIRAMDWTFGKGGKQWGLAADGLHLGDITIPIPFGQFLTESGPRAREARQAIRDLQEIQLQDIRSDIAKILKERREEMRRRSEEEAKQRRDQYTTSGGG